VLAGGGTGVSKGLLQWPHLAYLLLLLLP